ncbi:SpoIIE family protein phosphatase [Streptomyces sp. N35]|uniref:ATP-binding SpoIIE family protein phosphatase n=1 Tax=Streptomyces sp. N35 TaxID=2795730 RepID=UPI0018F37885|nr:SpoIIE family protein phosphatase [Streptomyces sp. N35]
MRTDPDDERAACLPPVGDVLEAVATGLWQWDDATGVVTLDAEAARLLALGTPEAPIEGQIAVTEAAIRSRFHPVDWNEIKGVVNLAVLEGTLAEARLRIMDDRGQIVRTIRSRTKPLIKGDHFKLIGTIQEVTEPPPGASARTPVTGDWRRSREAFLLDAGRALAEARSTAEVLRVAAGLSMPGFEPNGLAVFGVQGDHLSIIGHHGHTQDDEQPFRDIRLDAQYPAADVVRTGRAIYLSTPEEYSSRYPATWPFVRRFDRKSWAFLPLTVAGRTMGSWMAGFAHPVSFTPDERSVLTTVARMLAQALSRAGAAETERELTEGLQRSMLPTLGPEIPGLSVAARYIPTGGGLQVGGDWYDMIPLPNGRIALVIGDVQGHDVRAAGLMGQLRIALRAYASEGHRPDAVLSRASRFLYGITDSITYGSTGGPDAGGTADPRFATCLYLEADPATGHLEIARAGHPDPVVRTPDGTVMIRPTAGGLPLGIDPDADYPTTAITLEPGELLMLCTDGLIETGGHDMYTGFTRLQPILEQHRGDDLEELADALVQGVHGPSSHHSTGPLVDRREDDIAVVLLGRPSLHGAADEPVHPPVRRIMLSVAQPEPQRIAECRQQLRDLLHDWADPEQVDSAVLLVSEMVTNVLVHTDGDALLIAEARGELGTRRLRVEVSDSSDDLPHKRRPGELASSGRGLVLMELLADAWGVDPRGQGKSIWFELYEAVKL